MDNSNMNNYSPIFKGLIYKKLKKCKKCTNSLVFNILFTKHNITDDVHIFIFVFLRMNDSSATGTSW